MQIKKVGAQSWVDKPIPPPPKSDEIGEHFAPIQQMFLEREERHEV